MDLAARSTEAAPAAAPPAATGAGPGADVGPGDFRDLMSAFPSGVVIVTAQDADGAPYGMTCSSLCSVALAPPTLLVCLRTGSPTLEAVLRASAFSVNLLHDRAQSAAELFASGAPDRFDRIAWRRSAHGGGPHLVEHAHAVADCEVARTTVVSDHVVVFGTVTRVSWPAAGDRAPLIYGFRNYSSWTAARARAAVRDAGPATHKEDG